ncbi:DNA cytosine methyltransferase [Marinifilum fragile]|uniref:DNA cytosine methyltransferase n=1 Tax=Marinifilum fragile TaxID=570161 RepID=UPI002AAA7535|nr:DNA cytosine methyltransferase [Marinifilum fragile]
MKLSNKHIELFAGCGGMTLGLEAAGFDFYFANEISPMAAETFAYNILDEDLKEIKAPKNTIWINSLLEKGSKDRLRENPFKAMSGTYNDLKESDSLDKKMVVGDINLLLTYLQKNKKLVKQIWDNEVDLLSGGPPCQSFSLAGRRDRNNKRNELPWAFADFAELVKPKIVLLENVSGILSPFTDNNVQFYAWFEVAKAFCLKGYVPICMHINAKFFGLPQNRPRYIMLAIRANLISELEKDNVLRKANLFYKKVKETKGDIKIGEEYSYYELNSVRDIRTFIESRYLPTPRYTEPKDFRTVSYGINALSNLNNGFDFSIIKEDIYAKELEELFPSRQESYKVKNHNHRNHSLRIQKRFRFFKLIEKFENGDKIKLLHAIRSGSIADLDSRLRDEIVDKFQEVNNIHELDIFIKEHQTKKHSQRALVENRPAPAALSIPDDVCHYGEEHDRTLTVREMARIQSFPDWFEFRSKDTTGGTNRRFEVPNYTQVGNAVPPMLAYELGKWIKNILAPLK